MKLQKKHIIGIAIIIGILILGLVIWLFVKSSSKEDTEEYYEGETAPIEVSEDIFADEQEESAEESSDGKANADGNGDKNVNTDGSDDEKKNTDANESSDKKTDADTSSEKDVSSDTSSDGDTKEENTGTNMDEGWTPFY